jgi:hypothetical protein
MCLLSDFILVTDLNILADQLCEEMKSTRNFNEVLKNIKSVLQVASPAPYFGPSQLKMKETLLSTLYDWKQRNPKATKPQLCQHLLEANVGFYARFAQACKFNSIGMSIWCMIMSVLL